LNPVAAGGATGEPPSGSPVLLPEGPTPRAWRRLHALALGMLAFVTLLWALASLWWPFYWDHGIFAWIGDAIVHGGMPYRDAWDVKGPLTYYIFALVELLTGRGMWGIRAFDLGVLAVGMIGIFRVVTPLAGRGTGLYAALFAALQYAASGYNNTAQPDGWAALLIAPALVPLVRREADTRPWDAVAVAALVGSFALLKPTLAAWLALPALYLLAAPDLGARDKLRGVLAVGVAALLAPLLCVAWFAARGALPRLVDAYLLFNLDQVGTQPIALLDSARRFEWRLVSSPVMALGAAAAVTGAVDLFATRRRAAILLVTWLLAGMLMVWVQHRFWNTYHWHVVVVPFSVLAWVGLARVWRAPARVFAAATAATLFLPVLGPPFADGRQWLRLLGGRLSAEQYAGMFREDPLSWSAAADSRLAAYLRAHTAEREPVFVWSDPGANYLAQRPSVGRLIFHVAFNTETATPRRESQRAELLRDLAAHPPRLIVMSARSLEDADSLNETNISRRFPALAHVVRDGYRPLERIEGYMVYQRR